MAWGGDSALRVLLTYGQIDAGLKEQVTPLWSDFPEGGYYKYIKHVLSLRHIEGAQLSLRWWADVKC